MYLRFPFTDILNTNIRTLKLFIGSISFVILELDPFSRYSATFTSHNELSLSRSVHKVERQIDPIQARKVVIHMLGLFRNFNF